MFVCMYVCLSLKTAFQGALLHVEYLKQLEYNQQIIINRAQKNTICVLAKTNSGKSSFERPQIKDKILITTKVRKTTLNMNHDYPATKSWLLQPHHGSGSNIMAPVVTCWLL